MISEVSICNQALSWLGQNRITSLNDDSFRAELCRENYAFLRDAVIEERMWTFAMVRKQSETAERDEFDMLWVHQLPSGWLKVFRVLRPASRTLNHVADPSWRREGNRILTSDTSSYLWGVQRITDTGQFSNMFVQCLASRMATDLAMPLTEDKKKQEAMWDQYTAKLNDAAATDGQQGANDYITQSRLVDARYSGGNLG
jgi:hypothetical protein